MTDKEILELRNVLLVPDTLEECKRLVQLLWTNLVGSPWNSESLQRLECSYNAYKKENDVIVIEITDKGQPFWSSLSYYKKDCAYEKVQIIYLNSNKNMEARNITVTLEQAKEWYKSGNTTLKTLALNAYSENELNDEDWDCIYNAVEKGAALNNCAGADCPKFRVLHKLSIIAAYFNKDWRMQCGRSGYFIGEKYLQVIGCDKVKTKKDIFIHNTIMYSGIIYFRNKEDAEKAIKLLGEDIKYLF